MTCRLLDIRVRFVVHLSEYGGTFQMPAGSQAPFATEGVVGVLVNLLIRAQEVPLSFESCGVPAPLAK